MGRLENCNHFNAEEFIKNQKKWKKEKKRLLMKLDAISEIPSIENKSGVRGTGISDQTARQAILREPILQDLKDIERAEEAYNVMKSKLTDDEKEIIEGFFESRKPNWLFVSKWEKSHYMSQTSVYNERKRILKKIESIMDNYLGRD